MRVARRSAFVAAFVAVTALTGCMDLTYEVDVEADGSGRMTAEVLVDVAALTELAGAFGDTGGETSFDALCDEVSADAELEQIAAAEGVRTEQVRDGDRCGIKITFTWDTAGEFAERIGSLTDDETLTTDGPTPVDGSITPTDDGGWRFEMVLPTDPPTGGELDGFPPGVLSGLAATPTCTVTVSLPGDVVEHNGTQEGSTVTWSYDMLDPGFAAAEQRLFAVSGPTPGGGLPPVVFAAAALVAAFVGAVLFQRLRPAPSRRSTDVPMRRDTNDRRAGLDAPRSGFARPPLPPPVDPTPTAEPGWYDDPSNPARMRWWDGANWTEHTIE